MELLSTIFEFLAILIALIAVSIIGFLPPVWSFCREGTLVHDAEWKNQVKTLILAGIIFNIFFFALVLIIDPHIGACWIVCAGFIERMLLHKIRWQKIWPDDVGDKEIIVIFALLILWILLFLEFYWKIHIVLALICGIILYALSKIPQVAGNTP